MLLFQLSSLLWRMSEAVTQSCSVKKSALENFAKLTGNHLGIRSVTLLKKRLRHRVFPVNFVKFSRTPFFRTPLAAASGISAIHNDSSPFFY